MIPSIRVHKCIVQSTSLPSLRSHHYHPSKYITTTPQITSLISLKSHHYHPSEYITTIPQNTSLPSSKSHYSNKQNTFSHLRKPIYNIILFTPSSQRRNRYGVVNGQHLFETPEVRAVAFNSKVDWRIQVRRQQLLHALRLLLRLVDLHEDLSLLQIPIQVREREKQTQQLHSQFDGLHFPPIHVYTSNHPFSIATETLRIRTDPAMRRTIHALALRNGANTLVELL